jgi:hypothetical protein
MGGARHGHPDARWRDADRGRRLCEWGLFHDAGCARPAWPHVDTGRRRSRRRPGWSSHGDQLRALATALWRRRQLPRRHRNRLPAFRIIPISRRTQLAALRRACLRRTPAMLQLLAVRLADSTGHCSRLVDVVPAVRRCPREASRCSRGRRPHHPNGRHRSPARGGLGLSCDPQKAVISCGWRREITARPVAHTSAKNLKGICSTPERRRL